MPGGEKAFDLRVVGFICRDTRQVEPVNLSLSCRKVNGASPRDKANSFHLLDYLKYIVKNEHVTLLVKPLEQLKLYTAGEFILCNGRGSFYLFI